MRLPVEVVPHQAADGCTHSLRRGARVQVEACPAQAACHSQAAVHKIEMPAHWPVAAACMACAARLDQSAGQRDEAQLARRGTEGAPHVLQTGGWGWVGVCRRGKRFGCVSLVPEGLAEAARALCMQGSTLHKRPGGTGARPTSPFPCAPAAHLVQRRQRLLVAALQYARHIDQHGGAGSLVVQRAVLACRGARAVLRRTHLH